MKRLLIVMLVPLMLLSCQKGTEISTDAVVVVEEGEKVVIPEALLDNVNSFVDHIANLEKPTDLGDKFSYAYGNLFAASLFETSDDINIFYFMRGILDYYSESFFTEDELSMIFSDYQKALLSEAQERYEKAAKENLEDARDFLRGNAKRSAVVTLPSGLQYEILREGNGKEFPDRNDLVKIHYTITRLNGTVADSSYDRGEAFVFQVDKMLAGASEGLKLMSPGSKCRFWIPPELAYGENGSSVIGPNELLIFDVELFEIETK